MNEYFDLLANEFASQSAQIKQFVKSHGPSIGAAHEIMLRSFLKKYLPKWVSVGHGFILARTGLLSRECDIIIYNSNYYSPLYQIEDFVVLAPESVICVIEVKTVLNRRMLHDSLANLVTVKRIRPDVETSLIVFRPPSLQAICTHLESFDFTALPKELIPDQIFGLTKYALHRMDFRSDLDKTRGVGFMSQEGKTSGSIFELFYHRLYSKIEMDINKSIKDGIDNIWEEVRNPEVDGSSFQMHGRLGYASLKLSDFKLAVKVQVTSY